MQSYFGKKRINLQNYKGNHHNFKLCNIERVQSADRTKNSEYRVSNVFLNQTSTLIMNQTEGHHVQVHGLQLFQFNNKEEDQSMLDQLTNIL
jgi:hypothetical protein